MDFKCHSMNNLNDCFAMMMMMTMTVKAVENLAFCIGVMVSLFCITYVSCN